VSLGCDVCIRSARGRQTKVHLCTDNHVFGVDELGRATSNEDGVSLAWAVSEHLLKSSALTFFVTHYPQVTSLGDMYPSAVQNQHMAASVNHGEGGEILYTHKVGPGPCTVAASYGVELASACGWPSDVLGEVSHDCN
jgi:DNA mismatch repair ATPase MutS